MAGITLDIAQSQLDAYLLAEERLLAGHKSHRINDREFTSHDLAAVQAGIKIWSSRVQSLATPANGGRSRTMSGVPR